jgi:signal transduction histidine kinase
MDQAEVVERLGQHRLLRSVPRAEHEWLAAHGSVRHLVPGDRAVRKGEGVDGLYLLFSGRVAHHVERGGGRRKVMEWRAGDVTGALPYSRMTTAPGDSIVEEEVEALFLPAEVVRQLPRECPGVTAELVHAMLDRARVFNTSDQQDEKMISLGKLAAGLAHELNNPASAAARSAQLLAKGLVDADDAARALAAARLTDAQLEAADRARAMCTVAAGGSDPAVAPGVSATFRVPTAHRLSASVASPLERADREDALSEWLEGRGADTSAAAALADTAVTIEALDDLATAFEGHALDRVLHWLALSCANRALASDIEKAASRMHQLVSAVKGFTYMDRATVPELVDVGRGLADTVAVLAHKARAKSVGVSLDVPESLPRVRAFGGELNQVWANLIDNAIDAVGPSGNVTVSAAHEAGSVVVRVADDGPGIPAELQGRVFDPFFTTKPVGKGTGLGLDIANRVVRRNDGEIDLQSHPGRTEFRVSFPVVESA